MREVLDFFPFGKHGHDAFDILRRQPVVVCLLDALAGSFDQERLVVCLAPFQHRDAGGDACPEKSWPGVESRNQ